MGEQGRRSRPRGGRRLLRGDIRFPPLFMQVVVESVALTRLNRPTTTRRAVTLAACARQGARTCSPSRCDLRGFCTALGAEAECWILFCAPSLTCAQGVRRTTIVGVVARPRRFPSVSDRGWHSQTSLLWVLATSDAPIPKTYTHGLAKLPKQ